MNEKCAPDDPRRCIGITRNGQCEFLASEGSRHCDFHSNGANERRETRESINRYMIEREELKKGYEKHNAELGYLNLKDEITLMEAMLERRINMAKNDAEEMMAYRDAQAFISRLESMKLSLLKMQQQIGLVLGKDQLRALAKEIGVILNTALDGVENKESRLETAAEAIFDAIEEAGKQEEE